VQTTVFYDKDRSGGCRETTIEGSWTDKDKAYESAKEILLDEDISRADFAVYDVRKGDEEWEYGEDVLVHAVGSNGENIFVAVVMK
jgi:hypothetical protein